MDHHHHNHAPQNITRAFIAGIILNTVFVIVEAAVGLQTNSLSLLSDAWHNLSDISSLGIALLAIRIAGRKATSTYTYGYHKGTILASLVNAVILLIAVGSIGWEAIQRFFHPEESGGTAISVVAAIGIVINTISALLFFKDKDSDLNVKSAYLHLAADALVSFGVVIGGLAISYTGWMWIDPLVSILIMLIVITGTWRVLVESLRLSMDAVPEQIDLTDIKNEILKQNEVLEVYHIHVWAMSTSRNALTAHIVFKKELSHNEVKLAKDKIRHALEHLNIQHVTIETEVR